MNKKLTLALKFQSRLYKPIHQSTAILQALWNYLYFFKSIGETDR